MQELEERGMRDKIHVWVDDNLSGSYLEKYLGPDDIRYMAQYPNHSRAGCFKGIDDESVRATTVNRGASLDVQMRAAERLLANGFDSYFYLTLTGPFGHGDVRDIMSRFQDRLQQVHPQLPLRVLPLEIRSYSVTQTRTTDVFSAEMDRQREVLEAWEDGLVDRFGVELAATPPEQISLSL